MKKNKMKTAKEQPDDKVIFAPLEDINIIKNVIENLETTHRELIKVAQGMKPVGNYKL